MIATQDLALRLFGLFNPNNNAISLTKAEHQETESSCGQSSLSLSMARIHCSVITGHLFLLSPYTYAPDYFNCFLFDLTLSKKINISITEIMDDEFYMKLALEEACKASGQNEVPVGAVIIDKNQNVIGAGYNSPISLNDPTSHAEINAIRIAAGVLNNYRLTGTSLYVTMEPCIMCMGAIIHSRIKRVVFGAQDVKWGAVNSLYTMANDKRINHRPEIRSGVCEEKARKIIKDFFKNRRSK